MVYQSSKQVKVSATHMSRRKSRLKTFTSTSAMHSKPSYWMESKEMLSQSISVQCLWKRTASGFRASQGKEKDQLLKIGLSSWIFILYHDTKEQKTWLIKGNDELRNWLTAALQHSLSLMKLSNQNKFYGTIRWMNRFDSLSTILPIITNHHDLIAHHLCSKSSFKFVSSVSKVENLSKLNEQKRIAISLNVLNWKMLENGNDRFSATTRFFLKTW